MKTSELLRSLADLIAATEQGGDSSQETSQSLMTPVEVGTNDQEPELTNMVPPLQQKLELLKKSVDVNNAFGVAGGENELDDMKKMAGIQIMSDDGEHE